LDFCFFWFCFGYFPTPLGVFGAGEKIPPYPLRFGISAIALSFPAIFIYIYGIWNKGWARRRSKSGFFYKAKKGKMHGEGVFSL